jgi:hypothetical protein
MHNRAGPVTETETETSVFRKTETDVGVEKGEKTDKRQKTENRKFGFCCIGLVALLSVDC